jgi:hypothetical protein
MYHPLTEQIGGKEVPFLIASWEFFGELRARMWILPDHQPKIEGNCDSILY